MYSFDFLKMSPDHSFVVSGIPSGVFCRGISETGKQYALYHHHSGYKQPGSESSYVVTPGSYVEHLLLNLPGGTYKADWVDPASGSSLGKETFTHKGGGRVFRTREHSRRCVEGQTRLAANCLSNALFFAGSAHPIDGANGG